MYAPGHKGKPNEDRNRDQVWPDPPARVNEESDYIVGQTVFRGYDVCALLVAGSYPNSHFA